MALPERANPQQRKHYSHTWRIFGKGSKVLPEDAMSIIQSDPCCVFPFRIRTDSSDGRPTIQEGSRCILHPLVVRPEPVEIVDVSPTSFTFRTLPGHFRGDGATIRFRTFHNTSGRLCIQQYAEFEKRWKHFLLDIGSIALWSIQAARLAYQLHRREQRAANTQTQNLNSTD